MGKVWLITGCSTGFGLELTKVVAGRGDKVYPTVRKESQLQELKDINPELIEPLLLDVTDHKTIVDRIDWVLEKEGRIDVLVNNAGFGLMGTVEETSFERIDAQFDTNIYGPVRLIKAVIPSMRKHRSGHILNISSIAGLQGYPALAFYNASKFALEGISEALHKEVQHLGIKVTAVEPGPFRTDFAGRSANYNESSIDDYKDTAQQNMESLQQVSGKQIGDPVKAAEAMYKIVYEKNPPLHFPLGSIAYDRARKKFERMLKEFEEFEHIGHPTDYDE